MTAASVAVASTLGTPPARRGRAPGRAHPGTEQHGPPSRRAPEGSSSTRRGARSRSPGQTWASSCQAARITVTESPSGCNHPAHPGTAEAGVQQGPSHRCRAGIPGGPPIGPGGGEDWSRATSGRTGRAAEGPASNTHRQTTISRRYCPFCAGASRPGGGPVGMRTTTGSAPAGRRPRTGLVGRGRIGALVEVTHSRHRGGDGMRAAGRSVRRRWAPDRPHGVPRETRSVAPRLGTPRLDSIGGSVLQGFDTPECGTAESRTSRASRVHSRQAHSIPQRDPVSPAPAPQCPVPHTSRDH